MLYLHYQIETFVTGDKIVYFKFASHKSKPVLHDNINYQQMQGIITLIKQVPSGLRDYTPTTKIWMLPENKFQQVVAPLFEINQQIPHANLVAWALGQENNASTKAHWADQAKQSGNFKAADAEDFFKNNTVTTSDASDPATLKLKLSDLIKPYVSFALVSREDYLRGYKIAARRYHPDLGGDAAKMSELNMLWNQYKELV